MSQDMIVVENLSKSYLLGHKSRHRGRSNYVALRDVLGREIRSFARKTVDMVRGRQIVQGDEVEEFWALRDVSFTVKRGEALGIIGRNGAGKSTLLKILSRITEPTQGRVALRGRVASLLEVGTGFHPELTGRENIFLNGAILGMSQQEVRRKFDEIVDFAEVERFLDTPVKHFSSGMYVRLAFAVAAHLEPEILVVDEVLAVGDAEFQKKCVGKMDEVSRKDGRTVLFVSHNLGAMRSLCTHGLLLRNGIASPKRDIESTLEDYASDRKASSARCWQRPESRARSLVYITSIESALTGSQPNLALNCRVEIRSEPGGVAASMAAIISDQASNIMQCVPNYENYIGGVPGLYCVKLGIKLPPLIPGSYRVAFWLGLHDVETFDWISEAISFDVVDGPDQRKTPYDRRHGSILPPSTATMSTVAIERRPLPSAATSLS